MIDETVGEFRRYDGPRFVRNIGLLHQIERFQVFQPGFLAETDEIMAVSDKCVELSARYPRSPNLSAIHGAEFVVDLSKKLVHEYVYSDEFNEKAEKIIRVTEIIEDPIERAAQLERHFFADGLFSGIWLKVISDQSTSVNN